MSTFYKVRQTGTDLYYSPPSPAFYGGFDKDGKRYVNLMEARTTVRLLDVPCEVVHYIEDVLEVGVIQPNGRTKVALNQHPIPQRV